jgi:hypothetical protein
MRLRAGSHAGVRIVLASIPSSKELQLLKAGEPEEGEKRSRGIGSIARNIPSVELLCSESKNALRPGKGWS